MVINHGCFTNNIDTILNCIKSIKQIAQRDSKIIDSWIISMKDENLYCPNGTSTFNWDELIKNGGNEIPQLFWDSTQDPDASITIDEANLAINIHVELEYMG